MRFLGHHMAPLAGSSWLFMPVGAARTKEKNQTKKITGQAHLAHYEEEKKKNQRWRVEKGDHGRDVNKSKK